MREYKYSNNHKTNAEERGFNDMFVHEHCAYSYVYRHAHGGREKRSIDDKAA